MAVLKTYIDKTDKPIPKGYYERLAAVESNNDPNARAYKINKKTGKKEFVGTAAGLYQFTEGTWKDMTTRMGKDYSLNDRFDPVKSKEVVEYLTNYNKNYLVRKLGREPDETELYLAHFSGIGGARKLMEGIDKNPNLDTSSVYSEKAINNNKNVLKGKTVGDVYNWAAKKFGIQERDFTPIVEKPQPQENLQERYPTQEKDRVNLALPTVESTLETKDSTETDEQSNIIEEAKKLTEQTNKKIENIEALKFVSTPKQKVEQRIVEEPVEEDLSFIDFSLIQDDFFDNPQFFAQEGGQVSQKEIQGINQFVEQINNQVPKFNPNKDLNFIERVAGKVLLGETMGEMIGMYNNLVDFKNKRGDSNDMSEGEIDLRTRLKNAQQFKYPNSLQDLQDFTTRAKTGERQLSDNEVNSHKEDLVKQYNTRDALNSKYYGLDYDDKLIKKSKYKPSVGKDNDVEYIDFGSEYKQEQISQIKSKYASFGDLHKKLGKKTNILVGEKLAFQQLMNFTMGAGKDKKGKYISYYDKWDIDPPMLKDRGIDVDKLNNPFEIYGRIYEKDFE